jgi:hypothetical protein
MIKTRIEKPYRNMTQKWLKKNEGGCISLRERRKSEASEQTGFALFEACINLQMRLTGSGHSESVAAFVLWMFIVTANPSETDFMLAKNPQKSNPEIRIFFAGKSFFLPVKDPLFFYRIHDIF